MLKQNILVLNIVQAARLLIPLLVIPVLVRALGTEDFGVYMYTISFSAWLSIIVEYGFNVSSTRDIAGTKGDVTITRIVTATQSAKYLLVLFTVPLLAGAVFFFPPFEGKWVWASAAWVLGVLTGLQPTYYFQGRERLKSIGYAEVAGSACFLGGVLVLVRTPSGAIWIPYLLVAPRLIIVAALTRRISDDLGTSFRRLWHFEAGWQMLKSTFPFFVFQAAVGLYTSFNVVFLGFFCSPMEVGIYASAERVMRAGIGFLAQFSNAIFPRLNALKSACSADLGRARRLTLLGMTSLGMIGMVTTWIISPYVSKYFFAENAARVREIIDVLAVLVPAIALSNVFGFHFLIVDRREKTFTRIIFAAAFLNAIVAYPMIAAFEIKGMAYTWLLIEWFIASAAMAAAAANSSMFLKFGLSKDA